MEVNDYRRQSNVDLVRKEGKLTKKRRCLNSSSSSPVGLIKALKLDIVTPVESNLLCVGNQPGVNVAQVSLSVGFLGNLKQK